MHVSRLKICVCKQKLRFSQWDFLDRCHLHHCFISFSAFEFSSIKCIVQIHYGALKHTTFVMQVCTYCMLLSHQPCEYLGRFFLSSSLQWDIIAIIIITLTIIWNPCLACLFQDQLLRSYHLFIVETVCKVYAKRLWSLLPLYKRKFIYIAKSVLYLSEQVKWKMFLAG